MRGASAMELGAFTVFLYMIKAREYLWDLVEMVTGARLTVTYCRVGGVKGDLPEGFDEACAKAFKETRQVLKESDTLLTRNRIFVDRMSGTGKISADDAISYGITGPFLRAAALPTTYARTARTLSDRLESTCRSEPAATTSIAICSAWKRWNSPCGSSSRPSGRFRTVRCWRAPTQEADGGSGDGGSSKGRKHQEHCRQRRRHRSHAGRSAKPLHLHIAADENACSCRRRKTRTATSKD